MGRNKILTNQRIDDPANRRITYLKRRKGLVKKAMELSMLCEQEVYMAIYDRERHEMLRYTSTAEFDLEAL